MSSFACSIISCSRSKALHIRITASTAGGSHAPTTHKSHNHTEDFTVCKIRQVSIPSKHKFAKKNIYRVVPTHSKPLYYHTSSTGNIDLHAVTTKEQQPRKSSISLISNQYKYTSKSFKVIVVIINNNNKNTNKAEEEVEEALVYFTTSKEMVQTKLQLPHWHPNSASHLAIGATSAMWEILPGKYRIIFYTVHESKPERV